MSEEPVIFPDHFSPIPGWTTERQNKSPRIITGFTEERVILAAIQRGYSFKPPLCIDFQGRVLYFIFQDGDFLVFDPPIQSRSQKQGSRALYYAANEEWGFLLQYLPPNSRTSSHNHELSRWVEDYYLLAGEAILQTSEELEESNRIVVMPEVVHQVLTGRKPSLTLIKIQGDPNWFDKWLTGEGHTFKPLPEVPWEKYLS